MHEDTFAHYEREGWQRNAADYDLIDLPATRQAFAPLLESVGDVRGRRVLDVATGTGRLVEKAIAVGANAFGIDVADNMISLARERVPGAVFQQADAAALPFENAYFDAVLCCFGLLHFAEPAKAVREAARVLKPGGAFAFTVWHGPERGNAFFGLILGTYQAHANMDVGLPPAPPMFALADPAAHVPMLRQAGFEEVRSQDLPIAWPLDRPDTTVDFVLKGAVRSRMLYERQTPRVQQLIREALIAGTNSYLRVGADAIPCPALLVTARKAK